MSHFLEPCVSFPHDKCYINNYCFLMHLGNLNPFSSCLSSCTRYIMRNIHCWLLCNVWAILCTVCSVTRHLNEIKAAQNFPIFIVFAVCVCFPVAVSFAGFMLIWNFMYTKYLHAYLRPHIMTSSQLAR